MRVGRLVKAHGLKGGLRLELYTDDPARRFVPGASFALQVPAGSRWHGKSVTLAELRSFNGHAVAFFDGVTDREAAQSLVRAILWIDADPAEESGEPNAWYDHQLVGLTAWKDGEPVGKVVRVDHLPAQDLLAVAAGGREILVPFVKEIVPALDIARGTVVLTPPPGLFEDLPDDGSLPDGSPPGDEVTPRPPASS